MKIGFIGLGNMAQAMIGGVLKNHLAVPEEIYGSAKTAETESKVHEMFGITVTGDNLETARQAELLKLSATRSAILISTLRSAQLTQEFPLARTVQLTSATRISRL